MEEEVKAQEMPTRERACALLVLILACLIIGFASIIILLV